MMGRFILRSILGNIKKTLRLAILADEATDISHNEKHQSDTLQSIAYSVIMKS